MDAVAIDFVSQNPQMTDTLAVMFL